MYIYIYIYVYIYVYVYIYIYTYKYIHTHICTCIFFSSSHSILFMHLPLHVWQAPSTFSQSAQSLTKLRMRWRRAPLPPKQSESRLHIPDNILNQLHPARIASDGSSGVCTYTISCAYVDTFSCVYADIYTKIYTQSKSCIRITGNIIPTVQHCPNCTTLSQLYNIVPTVSCAESVAVFVWVLHHLQGSLNWLEEYLSVCPASSFKVICALSLLHFVRIQLRLLTKAVVYVHTHFHVCMQTYSRWCVCSGGSVAIHTNLCTCLHGCMYMCVHVWWWRWLRETLENTLTHLHKHTHTSVKELETQKISSLRTHKCTLPRKNMLHTRRNSSSKEWKRGGGWVERSWVWELMVCEEVVWSEDVVWFQTCQRFGQIQKTCIPGTFYSFCEERPCLYYIFVQTCDLGSHFLRSVRKRILVGNEFQLTCGLLNKSYAI